MDAIIFLLIILFAIGSSFFNWLRQQKEKGDVNAQLDEYLRKSRERRGLPPEGVRTEHAPSQPRPPVGPPPVRRPTMTAPPAPPPDLRRGQHAPAPPVPPPIKPVPSRSGPRSQPMPQAQMPPAPPATPDPYARRKERKEVTAIGAPAAKTAAEPAADTGGRLRAGTTAQSHLDAHTARQARAQQLADAAAALASTVEPRRPRRRKDQKPRRRKAALIIDRDDLQRLVIDNEIMMRPQYPRLRACQSMWVPPPRPRQKVRPAAESSE